MATILNPILINDSQLFKATTYDTDGSTLLTPTSCVCSVFNAETGAIIINAQAGTVGTGYAQYNWAGSATSGTFDATLTVTISAGVVKSESFRVLVLPKPPTFSYSLTTDIGKLRAELGDDTPGSGVKPDGTNLSDEYLQVLLTREGSVGAATAGACEALARAWLKVVNISVGQRREDLGEVAKQWAAMAVQLRTQYGGAGGTLETGVIRLGFADADEEEG